MTNIRKAILNDTEKLITKQIVDMETYGIGKTNNIGDGFHTFGELYEHRVILYLSMLVLLKDKKCKRYWSRIHNDGTSYDGWLLVGVVFENGEQISYHINDLYESLLRTTDIEEITEAKDVPAFDGHSPDMVLERLKNIIIGGKL